GRVGMARALAVLAACFVGTAAAPAAASAGTVYYSTADIYFSGKLWSVGDHGGSRHLLRQNLFPGPSRVIATISRDGRRILCLCRRGEVDSMRLDGSGMRRIGPRPPGTRYDLVALGAGGETVWLDERHNRLMIQAADGSHRRPVATPSRGHVFEE